ncbi:MAG: undecaprenyl-diphosphate phosphatase [Lachnospiraceae bacterium]|nr:undecaprenyl-diphosphate phosphatase [Lachnospiraceae bacterium]MBQ3907352.1 undecaprenyl-diphosphate phosphatase [Lachnospiraceae bacterium]
MDGFFDIIKAIIYGIVEGITEWLPVSSTGHLILVEEFLPFKSVSEGFFDVFDVVIQLGAIMAVVILFWNKIWPFKKPDRDSQPGIMGFVKMDKIMLWLKIALACIPAVIVGLLFDDLFDALFYNPVCVSIALIVFGIGFIVVENWNKNRRPVVRHLDDITFKTALLIGIFQLLAAIFPGTSRSGATILGALMIGVSRTVAAEFTFFLAIPVMFGASLLKLVKNGFDFSGLEIALILIGMVVSFVVSLFIVRFLMAFIRKHNFKIFGWYRIVLGVIVLLYFGLAK